nr:hypothetical protein [Iodidimonas nitroreducens]
MTAPSAICVRSLEKTYGGPAPKRALKGIDLDITQGRCLVF